ncbi:hypothetical protein MRI28_06685 [Nocardiopsis dassonvillei]|uniref:hypothetical protein n=1 Tax=Nocardiopsis dassonvillei TaxID=2014 RepID=UPI0020108511|nr:hypothetical protein [Nocardiopsis dassonvillei]MCK9869342.1 hypothetical protein [Nocardiopsis dassonvillei]
MRRNEALDALERAEAVGTRVRALGRWYAVYGIGYGLMSMAVVLTMGLSGTLWGVAVAMAVLAVALTALSVYQARQPVKPLGYARLHLWGITLWGAVYALTVVAGMYLFPQDPAWWIPMAVLSAVPTSVAGCMALRRSRSAV